MNKALSIKTIVAIGIGSAVFVILAKFAAIPTGIPNTSFQTTYAFLALIAAVFGPIAGALTGLIGHTLNDFTTYGSAWWSWIIVSAFIGLAIGLSWKKLDIESGEFGKRKIITFNIVQAIGWVIIAPVLDILIYAEPVNKVFTQGIVIALLNIITVAVIGTILLTAYAKTRVRSGSLKKEL